MSLNTRKTIFIVVLFLSYLPLFLFLEYSYLKDAQAAPKLFAAFCGMFGVILMTWQYLLGVRGLVSRFIPDLIWVNNWHKRFGIYGFLVISIHPTFMTIYYMSVGINFFIPAFSTRFDQYRLIGEIAYAILLVTWLTSALIRKRISFRWWKRIHIFNLVVLPLALIHSLTIGTTLLTTNLKYYWYFIATVVGIILVYRFVIYALLGWGRLLYKVNSVHHITENVVQIDLQPLTKHLEPKPGQFIYFRPLSSQETHPFTVSRYDSVTRMLSISPKCSGPFSCKLPDLQIGTIAWIDGPYGVFTQEAYTTEKPVVLVAGGIGITPFIRLIEKLAEGWPKQVILFYGNQTEQDIAYKELVEQVVAARPDFKLVHVISKQEDFTGEKGYIDAPLLQKYLGEKLTAYEYFLCGPDAMMNKVTQALRQKSVDRAVIHSERFSL
jgi:predicted ferric reductase